MNYTNLLALTFQAKIKNEASINNAEFPGFVLTYEQL